MFGNNMTQCSTGQKPIQTLLHYAPKWSRKKETSVANLTCPFPMCCFFKLIASQLGPPASMDPSPYKHLLLAGMHVSKDRSSSELYLEGFSGFRKWISFKFLHVSPRQSFPHSHTKHSVVETQMWWFWVSSTPTCPHILNAAGGIFRRGIFQWFTWIFVSIKSNSLLIWCVFQFGDLVFQFGDLVFQCWFGVDVYVFFPRFETMPDTPLALLLSTLATPWNIKMRWGEEIEWLSPTANQKKTCRGVFDLVLGQEQGISNSIHINWFPSLLEWLPYQSINCNQAILPKRDIVKKEEPKDVTGCHRLFWEIDFKFKTRCDRPFW